MSLTAKMAVTALFLGGVSPAWAGAGDGIRFGGSEGRLHPFVELEAHYDSNVFVNFVNDQAAAAGDMVLHVRPGLTLNVPGEMTSVEASAKLDLAQYLGLEDSGSKDLSKLYAEAALGITVNRTGLVGLELDNTFRRSDQPQALSLGAGVVSNYNALTVRVPWRPGGGALTFGLGGTWALEGYERFLPGSLCAGGALCDTATLKDLGYNDVSGAADVRWRFLPRTSATFMAEYFKRLPNKASAVPGVSNDPGGYRVKAGVTGLVTTHLSATLEAGYGGTTGVTDTFGTWLASAQVKWLPTETVSEAYRHDLRVDPTVQYELDTVRLEARQLVAGRYTLKAAAAYSRLGFRNGLGNTGIISITPAVEAELARWLRAELAYAYTDRASSDAVNTLLTTTDYGKNEVWLNVIFAY
jgi:hypothetical protein